MYYTDDLIASINAALKMRGSDREVYRHETYDRMQIQNVCYVRPPKFRTMTAAEWAEYVDRAEPGTDFRPARIHIQH